MGATLAVAVVATRAVVVTLAVAAMVVATLVVVDMEVGIAAMAVAVGCTMGLAEGAALTLVKLLLLKQRITLITDNMVHFLHFYNKYIYTVSFLNK